MLGIDGPAGSGKSTLAAAVAAAAGQRFGAVPVVGVDDFVGWADLDPDGLSWWPRLVAEVVEPLLDGRDAVWRRRDWAGDPDGAGLLPEPVRAPWAPVAVLEGVSVTRLAMAPALSLTVWVEAPPRVRLARGLARDGVAELEHWRVWQRMESAFFAADGTRARADLVFAT